MINIDCIEGIRSLSDNTVNLTVTSPPYNLSETAKKNPVEYNEYTDDREQNEYINWLVDVFHHVYLKTRDDGRLAINIGDQKNGAIPTHVFLSYALMDIGWHPMSTIIWDKKQTRNRSAWGSYLSPSCPSFPSPFEYILIFYKNSKKLTHTGISDLTKDEFVKFAYGVWEISPMSGMKKKYGHPAVFPSEIPYRLIKMLTYRGDVVLDPFAGIGTTLLTADSLQRSSIGFELDSQYCDTFHNIKAACIDSSH